MESSTSAYRKSNSEDRELIVTISVKENNFIKTMLAAYAVKPPFVMMLIIPTFLAKDSFIRQ